MSLLHVGAGMRKSKLRIPFLVMIISALIVANIGCNAANGAPAATIQTSGSQTTAVQTTTVQNSKGQSMEIEVEKVFPKVGFRFLLSVKDGSGQSIAPVGQIVADAYTQIGNALGAGKEIFIYEWKELSFTAEDYDTTLLGSHLILEWGDFHLISPKGENIELDTYITMDITLTMPDGTVLKAEKTDIDILIRFTCC